MISYEVQSFGAPLVRSTRPTPKPQGGEVLLRVLAAGVCHTDIHTWHGWYDLGGGRRLSMAERGISLPLTLGHEIVGEVVAAGPDAAGASVGQRRLVYPWIGCGGCKVCRRGQEQLCPTPRFLGIFRAGGYSDHVVVPDARYLIDIGSLPPEQAAPYACSGLTTYSAIRRIDPVVLREEPVVVIGAGGLGLMCVSLLKALGSPGVVVIEPSAERREAALASGATAVFDAEAPDLPAQVRAALGGSAWAVIDCVGAASTVRCGLELLVKGGQFILVGLFGGEITLPIPTVPIRSISIEGAYVGRLDDLHALMALVATGRVKPIPTRCCSLDHAAAALQALESGQVTGRLVLQPGSEPA